MQFIFENEDLSNLDVGDHIHSKDSDVKCEWCLCVLRIKKFNNNNISVQYFMIWCTLLNISS